MRLDTNEWIEFRVVDFFERMEHGKCGNVGVLMDGDVPYIATSTVNNGHARSVEDASGSLTSDGNCVALICDGNGSIGRNTYQAEPFVGSVKLMLGYHSRLNVWNGLFLVACLDKSAEVFGYNFAWKRSADTLKAETVRLPVTPSGEPDWKYMEETMRNVMAEREHALEELTGTFSAPQKEIDTSGWGGFRIGEIFPTIKRAKRRTANEYMPGGTPYVTNSTINNGVSGYLQPSSEGDIEIGQCITVNTVDGCAFWQESDFLANSSGNGLLLLRNEHLNELRALFLCGVITATLEAGFAVMLTSEVVRDAIIRLPVTVSGEPDWAYIETLMVEVTMERGRALDSLLPLASV